MSNEASTFGDITEDFVVLKYPIIEYKGSFYIRLSFISGSTGGYDGQSATVIPLAYAKEMVKHPVSLATLDSMKEDAYVITENPWVERESIKNTGDNFVIKLWGKGIAKIEGKPKPAPEPELLDKTTSYFTN